MRRFQGSTDVRFIDIRGSGHFLYMTRQADVLRELHAFIASLPAAAKTP